MAPWNRRFLLETIIFRFHVKLAGSSPLFCLWGCKTPYGRYSMFQANLWWKNGCFPRQVKQSQPCGQWWEYFKKHQSQSKNAISWDWTCMKHRSCLPKMSIFCGYQPQIILQSTCYIGKPRENMGTSFQYERARWQAVRTQSTTDPSKYTKATDGRMICHTKQSGCDF